MEKWGNNRAKAYFEAEVPENYSRPKDGASVREVQRWIRDKYEFKRFLPSDGHVPPPNAGKARPVRHQNQNASRTLAPTPSPVEPTSFPPAAAARAVPPAAPIAPVQKDAAPVQDLLDFTEAAPAPAPAPAAAGSAQVPVPSPLEFGQPFTWMPPAAVVSPSVTDAQQHQPLAGFPGQPTQQSPGQQAVPGTSPPSNLWGTQPQLAPQPAVQTAPDPQQRHQQVASSIMSMFSNPAQAQVTPMQTLAPTQVGG